jgi:hypothetical protein
MKLLITILLALNVLLWTGCSTAHPKMRVNKPMETIMFEGSY